MTDPAPQTAAPTPSPSRVLLPGIAVAFFLISPILLIVGWLIVMGTSGRNFFEGAPNQAMFGTVTIVVGIVMMLISLALDGARSIAQQHLEAMREITQDVPAGGDS